MVIRFAAAFAAAALCAVTGCEKKDAPAPAPKDATSGAASDPLQMAKDSVLSAVNDQIGKIDAYIEKLRASASSVVADQKPEFDKAMESINSGMTSLRARIEDMKKAGAMQWQPIGAEVSDTAAKLYNEARAAVEKWAK